MIQLQLSNKKPIDELCVRFRIQGNGEVKYPYYLFPSTRIEESYNEVHGHVIRLASYVPMRTSDTDKPYYLLVDRTIALKELTKHDKEMVLSNFKTACLWCLTYTKGKTEEIVRRRNGGKNLQGAPDILYLED